MDKMIIVPLNLFSLNQCILISDENGARDFAHVELNHLPEVLVETANVHSTNNIRLIGNKNYAEALLNEIKEYAIQNYADNNLNITIMEV